MNESNKAPEFSAPAEAARMLVNQQHLKQAWDTSQTSTRDDWIEWMHHLSVEFMKESPSHALRACMTLVDLHPPLAKELFNAAFISCWRELYEQYQVRPSRLRAPSIVLIIHTRRISSVPLSSLLLPQRRHRILFTAFSTFASSWSTKTNACPSTTVRSENML